MLTTIIVMFFILLFLGVPIAYSMGITAMYYIIMSPTLSGMVFAQKVYTATDSFSLMAIPFFMFAGDVMNASGITERLVSFALALVGHFRGGLAQASVVAGALMAGISGSGNADATAIGGMMLPMFEKEGYEEGFAVSTVAAAAALGPIIPPSIIMVIYANTVNLPIGRMFMAGIVPGILIALAYMIHINFYCKRNHIVGHKKASGKEIGRATVQALAALVMPLIIVGGVLLGIFTATEAGVVASVYGLLYGLINKRLTLKIIIDSLKNSMKATTVPVFIVAMASVFSYLLTIENMPTYVVGFLTSITDNQYVIMLLVILLVVFLGMFIDGTAIVVMFVPLLTPMAASYGLDTMYFAMIVVLTIVIGGLTPPVGITFYIVSSVRGTPLNKVVPEVWKFAVAALIVVLACVFIPQLLLAVPNYFMGAYGG